MRETDRRRGFALTEVLVALAILGTAALALVVLAGESLAAQARAYRREAELTQADAVLVGLSVAPWESLKAMTGRRLVGGMLVAVSLERPTLIRVEVRDATAGTVMLMTHRRRPLGAGKPDA